VKCGQSGCTKDATHIVYWPGQTTYQCESDKDRVVALGKVMGFRVDSNPISVEEINRREEALSQPEDLDE
jgi:hypothetical protein